MASILKVDTITGVTTAGSIAITGEGNSTTTNLQNGLLKGFAYYQQSSDTLTTSFNIASATDNGTGDAFLNLTNNVATANEPHSGSCNGAANTTVLTYETTSSSTTSSRRYNSTNSAASDALNDSTAYTLIAGDLA